MNKLLTTITLLCFSVAANADIYLCEAKAHGFVECLGAADGRESQVKFLIDTEKGYRYITVTKYDGNCRIDGYEEIEDALVVCSQIKDGSESKLIINLIFNSPNFEEDIRFTYTYTSYGQSVISYAGNCTKV